MDVQQLSAWAFQLSIVAMGFGLGLKTKTEDVRDLLGSNLPTVLRPALLAALEELEAAVHQWFRRVERDINRL